jgi:hypothetical protein
METEDALKRWNEDRNREDPYVPPGGYSTWWDVLKPLLLMAGGIAGAVLFRRQIAAFFTAQISLIVAGVSFLAVHLLSRVEKCEKQIEELKGKLSSLKRGEVESSK